MRTETPMVIDCQTCPVRHVRCDDCIVTALGQTSSLPLVTIGRGPRDHRIHVDDRDDRDHRDHRDHRDDEWDLLDAFPPDADDELPLDAAERRAVGFFVRAGLVDPQHAAGLSARRESTSEVRAVG